MGNINECCPKEDLCLLFKENTKFLVEDFKFREEENYSKIMVIQSHLRGYNTRRKLNKFKFKLKESITLGEIKEEDVCESKEKLSYNGNSENSEKTEKTEKEENDEKKSLSLHINFVNTPSSGNSPQKSIRKGIFKDYPHVDNSHHTPNFQEGFNEKDIPGRLLADSEVEMIRIQEKVMESENILGSFIIEEKEVLRYLEDYKYKLRKHQIQYANGSVYIGYLNSQWEREGYGIYILEDGSKYEGTFQNNKMWGRGRLIGSKGDYYEGEFEDDKASGFGKYVNKSGGIYIGYWLNDKQNGKGEELFSDGSQYEGFYQDGLKNGKGKFTWTDGSLYEGSFKNNNIEGEGIYRWRDGRIYQGEWTNNVMQGLGVFIWPDKKRYIGQYLNDKKSGCGIFIWPDGKKFEGEWYDGKQNGFGSITFAGVKKYGIWKDGMKDKWVDYEKFETRFLLIEESVRTITEHPSIRELIIFSQGSSSLKSDSSKNGM